MVYSQGDVRLPTDFATSFHGSIKLEVVTIGEILPSRRRELPRDTILDFFGYRIERATDFSRIQSLLVSLKPFDAGVPLVRVGGFDDGGYLLPNCLDDIDAVISPGVGSSSDFELYFAEKKIPCILIDGTVSIEPVKHPQFTFVRKMLAPSSSLAEAITLAEAVELVGSGPGNMILQMDIEGAEWEILQSVPAEVMKRFKMLVIEFHSFDKMLEKKSTFAHVEKVFAALLTHFAPVHIHINNYLPSRTFRKKGFRGLTSKVDIPPIFELTLLQKGLVPPNAKLAAVPHPLDVKNVPDLPDVAPPHLWTHSTSS